MIIVPVLLSTFTLQGVPLDVAMHMALATSLATIVVTGMNSAWAHHKQLHVHWPTAKALVPFLVLGSALGVTVAHHLSGQLLSRAFVGFMVCMSFYIWFSPEPKPCDFGVPNWRWKLASAVFGTLSAILGVGGALFLVPFLKSKGMGIRHAIGTAAFCGVPLALTGALGYMWAGEQVGDLPGLNLGYIHLTAFAGIVLTSSVFSRVGARLVSRISPNWTRRSFAVFLWVLVANLIWKQM